MNLVFWWSCIGKGLQSTSYIFFFFTDFHYTCLLLKKINYITLLINFYCELACVEVAGPLQILTLASTVTTKLFCNPLYVAKTDCVLALEAVCSIRGFSELYRKRRPSTHATPLNRQNPFLKRNTAID